MKRCERRRKIRPQSTESTTRPAPRFPDECLQPVLQLTFASVSIGQNGGRTSHAQNGSFSSALLRKSATSLGDHRGALPIQISLSFP